MRLRAKLWLTSLLAVVTVASSFFASSPAMAVQYDCPSGYFCIWTDAYGWGSRYQWTATSIGNGVTFGAPWNNAVESIFNRTGVTFEVFDHVQCFSSPWWRPVVSGQWVPDTAGSDWANRISSAANVNTKEVPC
jgi:hypothetical protein